MSRGTNFMSTPMSTPPVTSKANEALSMAGARATLRRQTFRSLLENEASTSRLAKLPVLEMSFSVSLPASQSPFAVAFSASQPRRDISLLRSQSNFLAAASVWYRPFCVALAASQNGSLPHATHPPPAHLGL